MAAEPRPIVNVDQIKFDLCCAARILFRAGMSAANAGHISSRIAPDRMLMNRFGPSFGTLLPHDVLTLDFRGNIVEDQTPQQNARVNETVELHGVIHRYNPELVCALHTHPPATVTFSVFRKCRKSTIRKAASSPEMLRWWKKTTKGWPRTRNGCERPRRQSASIAR